MNKVQEKTVQGSEDWALVQRHKEGDPRAFGQLVERYQRKVFAQAIAMVKDGDEAMDVSQDVFVKVHRSLGKFQGDSSFSTWLYRIVHNMAIDHLRRRARRSEVDLDEGIQRKMERGEGVEAPAANPEERLGQQEELSRLDRALASLTDKHRAILVLREIEGLSYTEIAEVVGCSLGTVMSRLFHARRNMKKALAEGE